MKIDMPLSNITNAHNKRARKARLKRVLRGGKIGRTKGRGWRIAVHLSW